MFLHTLQNKLLRLLLVFALMVPGCSKKENPVTGPSDSIPGAATISLNSTQQVIRGFGGQNMPGWIPDLTPGQVQEAFGTGIGQIGMTILRIRVPYDSAKFILEVPTAQLAKLLGATIIASPWTPPPSMKSNTNIIGGILNTSSYSDYANYFEGICRLHVE
jgi:glucuronoarabinoxylan endo-1,4-beta-xylanase